MSGKGRIQDDAGPASSAIKRPTPSSRSPRFLIPPSAAFIIFFGARLIAALYAPIQDCDETFNYWEPTHYLVHGSGLQTWEYSPEYAIRSWCYAGLHAIPAALARLVPLTSKSFEFYSVRAVLAAFCAFSEARLFSAISRTLNPRAGWIFMLAMIYSPGMFHASAAYLPSSFAMYCVMLGTTAFMDWRGGLKTSQGMMWFSIGALIGWPFAMALIVPFMLEEVLLAALSDEVLNALGRYLDGTVRSLLVLALEVAIDTFFYRVLVAVPFNIVWYNVLNAGNKGPDIFGTEPWHFYIRNLFLNFNIWFLLAVLAGPLLAVQYLFWRHRTPLQTVLRSTVFVTPFYLWLAIFTLQPHKEERFMYPAYPLLALNAAISSHILLASLGSTDRKSLTGRVPSTVKLGFVSLIALSAIFLGLWRMLGQVTAFSAPLKVYDVLNRPNMTKPGDTVCLGKEWYRFPSSFHIPEGVRPKFVKSEFSGLLPGEFSEASIGFGVFPGAWLIPPGMNDENREDPSKYIDISHCSFLVDSYFPGKEQSNLEPDYVTDGEHWEHLDCRPFLDASRTGFLGRALWLPDTSLIPEKFRRQWGQYCMLRKISK